MLPNHVFCPFKTPFARPGPDAPGSASVFNAGVFLVRGTPAGRRILDDWCALYNRSLWTRVPWDGSSSSSVSVSLNIPDKQQRSLQNWRWQFLARTWAGEAFEQGTFVRHILPLATEYGIRSMPYYVFNEVHCVQPHRHSIAFHMYGNYSRLSCVGPSEGCVMRSRCFHATGETSVGKLALATTGIGDGVAGGAPSRVVAGCGFRFCAPLVQAPTSHVCHPRCCVPRLPTVATAVERNRSPYQHCTT